MSAAKAQIAPGSLMVRLDRKSTVIPARPSQPQQLKLCPSDLQTLCINYIQKGLFYHMPFADDHHFVSTVELLKKSLSEVLVHFYPLAGRLITSSDGVMYIDCNDAGANLIEASAPDVGIQEITEAEISPVVRQLFALDGAINLDGHFLPLFVVQRWTDDGFTINHAVVDGTSFWNFINSWADICRGAPTISYPPLHNRCFDIEGSRIALNLPQTQTMDEFSPPVLTESVFHEKVFHFSKETIWRLKDRANQNNSEAGPVIISPFQALCAHIWQAITRARGLLPHEPTTFKLAVNCRTRLIPPLPYSYFGNVIQLIGTTATAGELLGGDISYAASLLHSIIWPHGDAKIRAELQRYIQHPTVVKIDRTIRTFIGSSPRFPEYENDFGWGRPVCVRSGWANKLDGKVSLYPGREVSILRFVYCLLSWPRWRPTHSFFSLHLIRRKLDDTYLHWACLVISNFSA